MPLYLERRSDILGGMTGGEEVKKRVEWLLVSSCCSLLSDCGDSAGSARVEVELMLEPMGKQREKEIQFQQRISGLSKKTVD